MYDAKPLSAATKEVYARALKLYQKSGLEPDVYLRRYRVQVSPATYNMTRAALISAGLTVTAEALPRSKSALRRPLSAAEMRHLIDVACQQDPYTCALVTLMATTGLRTIEVCRAEVRDYVGNILHVHGKGRTAKSDYVVVPDVTQWRLRAHITAGQLQRAGPLFPHGRLGLAIEPREVRYRLDKVLRLAGLKRPGISAHSLRHGFACMAIEAGADLDDLRQALRHSSLSQTEHYAREALAAKRAASGAEHRVAKYLALKSVR